MKIKVKKFQVGGQFASLAVQYIPTSASTTAGAYAPAIASSEGKSSNSSSSSKDELNIKDVLKVFDNVKGLPVDVQYVLKDFKQMFDDDTLFSFSGRPSYSSLVNYYLNNIGKFNALGHSKELYDEARKELIANNSMDEVAIDRRGRLVVATEDGGLDAVSLKEFEKGSYKPITNRELLDLRQNKLPFGDSIYQDMTGVSMDQIIKKVNAVVHSLGSSEKKLEGYTVKQSDNIKSGLAALQEAATLENSAMTVDGLYKNSIFTKDQKQQAELALKAVYNSLTPQEQTLLAIHSSKDNPLDTLSNIIYSRTSSSYEFNPTLQANLNLDGTSKKTEKEKQEAQRDVNPLLMMQMMQGGEQRNLVIQTSDIEAVGVPAKYYSAIPKADDGAMSMEQMLSKSGFGSMLQGDVITFGDQPISKGNLGDIMYNNNGGYMAILPCITDTLGNKVVDLSVLDQYKEVARSINKEVGSPEYYAELAKGLKEKGLDELLTGSDTLNLDRFQQFFVVQGYTTDRVLKGNDRFKDSQFIKEVADTSIADRMKKALSSKENGEYDIDPYDKWGIFEFWNGWDDIYTGTVYIPITSNQNSPYLAYGQSIKQNFADQNETDYQRFNSKLRGFNPNNNYIQ